MNIVCAVFGMWCATTTWASPKFYGDWRDKVISGPTIPDVVVQVPPCQPDGLYNAEMISKTIADAQRIQDTVSPTSDAAAYSTTGAIVSTRLPPGTCYLTDTIRWFGPEPVILDGGGDSTLYAPGVDYIIRIEKSR